MNTAIWYLSVPVEDCLTLYAALWQDAYVDSVETMSPDDADPVRLAVYMRAWHQEPANPSLRTLPERWPDRSMRARSYIGDHALSSWEHLTDPNGLTELLG